MDYLAVGIDIGLTGTGVAYSSYLRGSEDTWQNENKVVEEWPGTSETIYKVPTRIAYQSHLARVYRPWGFLCDPDSTGQNGTFNPSNYEVKEYFKLLLEDSLLDQANQEGPGPTSEEVQTWFTDFLSALYNWIQQILSHVFQQDYSTATVEYIFSVPTTWRSQSVIDKFKTCIRNAGFAKLNNQFFTIGLTEAEAAAVYTMNNMANQYKVGDTLIICDAGGGTTDITVLTVTSLEDKIFRMKQLGLVEGDEIGSVLIDNEFKAAIRKRLLLDPDRDPTQPLDTQGFKVFQDIKHQVGTPAVDLLPTINVPIPAYKGRNCSEAGIQNGRMQFAVGDIKKLFDDKITRILELINRQLRTVENREVAYLVLSGGLGSSKYVKDRIENFFTPNLHLNAKNMRILQATEPQLAVCKGLVIDRMLRLSRGIVVISRLCRASYGILHNERFRKERHPGQTAQLNKVDGKYYAMDQIKWLIEQGQVIDEKVPLKHLFTRNIDYGGTSNKRWHDRVVMYNGPREFRPTYLRQGETVPQHFQVVREIRSDLEPRISDVEQGAATKKYKHWFRLGRKYWEINYEVRINIGAADVGFELWYNNRKRNREGDEIVTVDWQATLEDDESDESSTDMYMHDGHPGQRVPGT